MKCIPKYTFHERTYCNTVDELRKNHAHLLQTCRHVRYMWIPDTDTIVVVVSNVAAPGAQAKEALLEQERLAPFRKLLRQLNPDCGDIEGDGFAQLRERCLAMVPLDSEHVARANQGERIDESTALLGFEGGDSQ